MNLQTKPLAEPPAMLSKPDPNLPALVIKDGALHVRGGVNFAGWTFEIDALVQMPKLVPGVDYAVVIENGAPFAMAMAEAAVVGNQLAGFHYAPGGNAAARTGGDDVPAINPHSLWDRNFRPACIDPRGMTLVEGPRGKFWCDIYLTGVDHLRFGTSSLSAMIADGDDPPVDPEGGNFKRFDYATAVKVLAHHGKQLLSFEEFATASYGVTEKSSCSRDPKTTKLDAARTSKWGLMQATGNLWVWGHDGDPDEPRPSFLGGAWFNDQNAGSRYASLGGWAEYSDDGLGARGRSDHLQHV